MTDPGTLESAVKEYQAESATEARPEVGLVAGLIADFGLGNEPALRRRLYERLQRLVLQHGQKVELLIEEKRTMALHDSTKRPGHYFAKAICLALRENGLV